MTFREIVKSDADQFYLSSEYEDLGIELVENSPEEIKTLVIEMDERLRGTWQDSEEDRVLRGRLADVLKIKRPHEVRLPLMGTDFLRNNRHLLD